MQQVLAAQSVDDKNMVLCDGIYQYFSAKYGIKKTPKTRQSRVRRHNRAFNRLTNEKNSARRELRAARRQGKEEGVIREVARRFHQLIRLHSKAKRVQLRSWLNLEAGKARQQCAKNFWRFAAQILDGKDESPEPAFSAGVAEAFFKKVYSTAPELFQHPSWLPESGSPECDFNDDPITISEISGVIKRINSSSSPSPIDRVSYKIFKHCPSLMPALLNLYNACWESQTVPMAWKQGVIRLIPKQSASDDPADPGNYRPIALTSCVGKVFTSIMKDRWLQYMIANGYLDTNIQKVFVRNIPGCTEQYRKLLGAISEAFKRHKSITVCWLDLANAYGSVNHGLIDFTLQHLHATPKFRNTVFNLYSDLNVVVTSPTWTTNPIPLRVGVYQGDPLSVVIFNSVMATLAESLKQYQQLGYSFSNSPRSLTTLQYADDTCLVADGPSSCQKLLQHVERWLDWAGMRAKVPKCHSLAIHATSGKTYDPSAKWGHSSIHWAQPCQIPGSLYPGSS